MNIMFFILARSFVESLEKVIAVSVAMFIVGLIGYLYERVVYPGISKFRKSVEEAGFNDEQSKLLVECFKHKRDTSELWDKNLSVEQMKEILRRQNRMRDK